MGLTISRVFSRLFGKKLIRILIVGLDAAGKTTILYKIKMGEVVHSIPTIGFNVETLKYKNICFNAWDMGGQQRLRPLWLHYLKDVRGLIYVVDSSDPERIQEAKEQLVTLLNEEELRNAALLVYANKQDVPKAMKAEEIATKLGLHLLRDRNWYIQAASATKGSGLFQGLDWLSNQMEHR